MQLETDNILVDRFNEWYLQIGQIYNQINHLTGTDDLNYDQFLILRTIKLNPNIEMTKLSECFNLSGPAIARKVNVLFKKHLLVKNRSDESDQRKVFITLNTKGLRIVNQLEVDFYLFFKQIKDDEYAELTPLFEQTRYIFERLDQVDFHSGLSQS
ncbi:transcriptional regulator, SarA/Rot family [Latilactobacillus graminis]|uniref:MarR family protein n=2 Tax=Latilactobacillus graminis TaxID=60519 RepID=A0AA89I2G4_9LACO|nr:MarR family transcriptional regulator [Latilactobacillus graminis]KRM23378.1 marR family protein [Latilactobacillus graminis DSM 20719]QFP80271.1 MarR family transcriptional regulator [Latilactobacillus graminis]